MKKQSLNILFTLLLSIAWANDSFACKCEGEGTVTGSVKHADAVISGKVVSVSFTRSLDTLGIIVTGDSSKMKFNWREIPFAVVKIRVDKIYKGQITADTITILTPKSGNSCGFRFELGENYIVYATVFDELLMTDKLRRRAFDNKTFWTHQCTRTQNWSSSEEKEILNETKKG